MDTQGHSFNGTFPLNKTATSGDIEVHEQGQHMLQIFLILSMVFIAGEFIAGPTPSLADSASLDRESFNYGKFRLWAYIGHPILYSITSPLANSQTVKVCNIPIGDDYGLTMFPVSIFMLSAFAIGLFKVNFKQDEIHRKYVHDAIRNESSLKGTLLTFRSLTFLITVFYLGIVDGEFTSFMFWFLTDVAPSQATWIIGVTGTCLSIAAALSLGYSGSIMRRSIRKFNIPPPGTPRATPRAFEILKIGLFKFTPLGAKKPFICPTN